MRALVRGLPAGERECGALLRGAGVEVIGSSPRALGSGFGAFGDFAMLEADEDAIDNLSASGQLRVVPLTSFTLVVDTAEAKCD